MYLVLGGQYNDTAHKRINNNETYGPYNSYDEAYKIWQSLSYKHFDNHFVKYTIKEK